MISRKKKLVTAVALVALLGLSACANPSTGDPDDGKTPNKQASSTIEAVPEIADMLPAKYQESGVITIGALSTALPVQFTEQDGELVGAMVELYEAAAKVLDVEAEFDIVTADALQPGLDSGRYDVATLGDNPDRQKLFDIMSVYQNGAATITHASSEVDEIDYLTDLCGHTVAMTKGTLLERRISTDVNDTCIAAGKPELQIHSYVDDAGVALAVSSQQDEFGIFEIVVAQGYAKRDPDVVKVVDMDVGRSSGAAFKKDDTELRDAFRAALLHLVDVGLYEDVMTKYGLKAQMLPELPINIQK